MQSDQILISVIIPIYNQELYLEDAIQSVLSQDHGFVELILVNDGSTDKSSEICYKYIEQYNHIRYYEQTNRGVSAARNRGLEEVLGSYVFFLDADDTIDVSFLREALEVAVSNQSDITVVGSYYWFRSKHIMALPTCAMFLKTDFLKKYSEIRFPVGIQPCEDGLFSHQLLALTSQVSLYPDGVYHYRQHDNQNHIVINQSTDKVLSQIPEWLNILHNFYTKHDLYRSHALHLALFIEHEPFEFRYLGMSFDKDQKSQLYKIIRTFIHENVLPFLNKIEKREFSNAFNHFIELNNVDDFDHYFIKYKVRKRRMKTVKLFFLKFLPFSKMRRKLRKQIIEMYHKI